MNDKLQLWTAWCDYFATGQGRTLTAYIGYAVSEDDLRQRMRQRLDEFWVDNCYAKPGFIRNDVTEFLWSPSALAWLERCRPQAGALVASAQIHVNMS